VFLLNNKFSHFKVHVICSAVSSIPESKWQSLAIFDLNQDSTLAIFIKLKVTT